MGPHAPPSIRRQRGSAALAVTVLVVLAMLIVVAVANRNVVVEVRTSANQYRSTQAFEAAEAGLEWALARLNDSAPIGDDCQPVADSAARSFRDRYLRESSTGFVVATWDDAGTPQPLQAACVRGEDGWSCSCPATGPALPAAPSGTGMAPNFAVQFQNAAGPGLLRAVATGCTRSDAVCGATSNAGHEAAVRLEVAFGLVPGLRAAPVAALTVRGDFDAGASALGVHNQDTAAAGLAVHAGGNVAGSALRLSVPAGSPLDGSIVTHDTQLAGLDDERFFARWFAMDRAAWIGQPAATPVACTGDCTAALANAVAAGGRLLAVEGPLSLAGPLTLGSPARPIVLLATGALRLRGAVALHGVVVAGSLDWRDAAEGSGASIRGAALVAGDYTGDAAADFVHDAALLARLQATTGTFARVNGSWKDF